MAIRVVRLGTPRQGGEGVRLGTVRRPPRGVRKEELGRRDYFDVWVPELAPSAPLVSWALSEPFTPRRWARFARDAVSLIPEPLQDRRVDAETWSAAEVLEYLHRVESGSNRKTK